MTIADSTIRPTPGLSPATPIERTNAEPLPPNAQDSTALTLSAEQPVVSGPLMNLSSSPDRANSSTLGLPQAEFDEFDDYWPHQPKDALARLWQRLDYPDTDQPRATLQAADHTPEREEAVSLLKVRDLIRLGDLEAARAILGGFEPTELLIMDWENHAFDAALTWAMYAFANGASRADATQAFDRSAHKTNCDLGTYLHGKFGQVTESDADRIERLEAAARAELHAFIGNE